ncbi:hypothetical protein [Nitrospina watsonii]|uniref:Uncharacterized protein n=1 Tax=Nitrospina watsonii TaxID=1323948 RepID=A0ABM9HGL3_9BACT|nr:hypothetical protein [Nitrospina watsonii]CAI2719183.1 conserved protein of unknown function [Nitrospina watsonii]
MGNFNVLIAAEFKDITREAESEITLRLEEACFERIPTLSHAWEIKLDAPDEAEAKNDAIEKFVNVCRTNPFELRMVVQSGTGIVIRRKKQFEP